jgi:Kef-type K+ transport system membrane component KefB
LALVGQLLVGVALGPSLLAPWDGLSSLGPELTAIQVMGTIFIVFMAGLLVTPGTIIRMGASEVVLGVGIFVVPFAVTSVVVRLMLPGASGLLPLFIGLTISITALPVMGVMLAELGLLRERIGALLMDAALVNELFSVSVFAILLRLTEGGTGVAADLSSFSIAILSVAVFMGVVLGIHELLRALDGTAWWGRGRLRAARSLRTREVGLALVLIFVIVGALFSQYLGLTYILGAFYAGVLISEGFTGLETHWAVQRVFDAFTWGFFIPLFFAFVGVEMDLHRIASVTGLLLLAVLAATAIVTKVGTGYSIARLFGWSSSDAFLVGQLVSSRGAVELAMAVVLLSDGIFSTQIFTIVAAVGLVTTVIAPLGAGRGRSAIAPQLPSSGRGAIAQGPSSRSS